MNGGYISKGNNNATINLLAICKVKSENYETNRKQSNTSLSSHHHEKINKMNGLKKIIMTNYQKK